MDRGALSRSTSATLMNEVSSRSHGIFTIFIEQHKIDDLYQTTNPKKTSTDKDVDDGYTTAKFHFVDLAGSERIKKTGA